MGKKILFLGSLAIIIMITILLANSFFNTGFFALSSERQPVQVGAVFPFSGSLSYFGPYLQRGFDIAVSEINGDGGINGHKLAVIYEDSQSATAQGITAYNKLSGVNDIHTIFVTISGPTLGIAPLAEKNHDLLFNVGSASPKISEAGDYVFRHNLLPDDEASFLANSICNKFNYKEIVVLYANTEAGVAYKNLFEKDYLPCGTIKAEETYDISASDFRTQLSKIRQANTRAVLLISYTQEAGLILNQAKELGLNVQWFDVYAVEGPTLIATAGKNADGLIYTHFFAENNSKEYQDFKNKFVAAYGVEPEFNSVLAYDSMKVLAKAMKQCTNPEDAVCIKNELYKTQNFFGLTGPISFDANGDTRKTVILKTVKDGKFVPYKTGQLD